MSPLIVSAERFTVIADYDDERRIEFPARFERAHDSSERLVAVAQRVEISILRFLRCLVIGLLAFEVVRIVRRKRPHHREEWLILIAGLDPLDHRISCCQVVRAVEEFPLRAEG